MEPLEHLFPMQSGKGMSQSEPSHPGTENIMTLRGTEAKLLYVILQCTVSVIVNDLTQPCATTLRGESRSLF